MISLPVVWSQVLELLRALSAAMRPTLSPLEQCAAAARVIASHTDIALVMCAPWLGLLLTVPVAWCLTIACA